LSDWLPWVAGGLVLLGLEMLVPGAFLMWIGIGALGTGLLAAATGIGFGSQVVACAVLSGISITVGLRLRRPVRRLNTRTAGLVGRPATALSFDGRTGRVRLGDSDWAARVPHDIAPPEPGAHLRVVDVDGTTLIVRPETG
jgi:membrane protein implicated in regulation of membrane protease activity